MARHPAASTDRANDPVPPGPSEPRRPNTPIEDPPPPVDQPDGFGDPEDIDESGEVIDPPVQEPPTEEDTERN